MSFVATSCHMTGSAGHVFFPNESHGFAGFQCLCLVAGSARASD
jgi:hypothetical protein